MRFLRKYNPVTGNAAAAGNYLHDNRNSDRSNDRSNGPNSGPGGGDSGPGRCRRDDAPAGKTGKIVGICLWTAVLLAGYQDCLLAYGTKAGRDAVTKNTNGEPVAGMVCGISLAGNLGKKESVPGELRKAEEPAGVPDKTKAEGDGRNRSGEKEPEVYFIPLEEVFRLGMENSLRLRESMLKEEMARSRVKKAMTERFPEIGAGVSVGYLGQPVVFRRGLSGALHPDAPDWSHNYKVEINQPIYGGGVIRHTIRRAVLERRIAALSADDDRAGVKMLLLEKYLELFRLYKQREVTARNVEESSRRLEDIRRMRKEGVITRNDEIRSELELSADRLSFREAGDNIAIVSLELNVVLGLDESLILQPDTALLYKFPAPDSYEDYLSQAYENYPGLNIARYNTELSRNDVKLFRADQLPVFSLHAGNTLARPLSTTLEDVFANNWNVMLNLSFNLSSFYKSKYKLRQARQQVEVSLNREQQILQEIRVRVRSAYIRYREALDRVETLSLSVRQARENYRIVRNRYLNQLSILTDLLDASGVWLDAELQLVTARTKVVYSYYQLLEACGKL